MADVDWPTAGDTKHTKPSFLTQSRVALIAWFRERDTSLAELYEGALELAYGSTIPGWPRFVCHAMREIGNRLPDVIIGPTAQTKKDALQQTADLADAWTQAGYPIDGSPPAQNSADDQDLPTKGSFRVSPQVLRIVAAIVCDYRAGLASRRDATHELFVALTPEDDQDRAKLRRLADDWHKLRVWSVRRAHVSIDGRNAPDECDCRSRFEEFETILGSLVWEFFVTAGEIDAILDAANS